MTGPESVAPSLPRRSTLAALGSAVVALAFPIVVAATDGGRPGGDVVRARDLLACDGVTDDRPRIRALLAVDGLACGRTLDMSGCVAMLSNAGGDESVAVDVQCAGTAIVGDGSGASGFKLAGRVCGGRTTSPGAGCETAADCSGEEPGCSYEVGSSVFAPLAGADYAVVGSTRKDLGPGRGRIRITDLSFYVRQVPSWGRTETTGKACRGYCPGDPVTGAGRGASCDEDADCARYSYGSSCTDVATGIDCRVAGLPVAGPGRVRVVDFAGDDPERPTAEVEFAGNTVYDLAFSDGIVKLGAGGRVSFNQLAARTSPVAFELFAGGDWFEARTAYAIGMSVQVGSDGWVEGTRDARGDVRALFGQGRNVAFVGNLVRETAPGAIGIEADGESAIIDANLVEVAGDGAIGILVAGRGSRVVGNGIAQRGGGAGAAIRTRGPSTITANSILFSGAAPGVDVAGSLVTVTGNTLHGLRPSWAPGIRVGDSQVVATGNVQSGGGWCLRPNLDVEREAKSMARVNVLYSGNRCYAPAIGCATTITGYHFAQNYCAWIGVGGTPLWIGDSGRHANEMCTDAGVPWPCCAAADRGNCDGTSEGATVGPSNAATGYGAGSAHVSVVGNLFHAGPGGANTSLVKVADVGMRCSGASPAACDGADGAALRGRLCPCATDADCAGRARCGVSVSGHDTLSFSGNVLFSMQPEVVGFDASLDDDDFGTSRNEDGAPSARTRFEGVDIAANTFATSTALEFADDAATREGTRRIAVLANAFGRQVTTRFANWRWSMGVKDDNPVAVLLGSTAGSLPRDATNYVAPMGVLGGTSEENVDLSLPAGIAFRYRCRLATAPGGTASRVVTMRRNGESTAMPACSIVGDANTCSLGEAEIGFAENDRMAWEITAVSGPASSEAYCSVLYEITQPEVGWRW